MNETKWVESQALAPELKADGKVYMSVGHTQVRLSKEEAAKLAQALQALADSE